jgi:beta-xylosidase
MSDAHGANQQRAPQALEPTPRPSGWEGGSKTTAELLEVWRDSAAPVTVRVRDLIARMTLPEKAAQLYSAWLGMESAGGEVAPMLSEFVTPREDYEALLPHGLGQLTRVFGSAPVDPALGARDLARTQRQIMAAGRFGIPALAHEECLTGLGVWHATVYPSPLCWGASFDPTLVEQMATQIGTVMRRLGVHQGLAPVLDVVRDLRWGRVEETIGEDPYLIGAIGTAYVRGLESAGVVATLKHFVGYSASRAGRNLAPVPIGPREVADVLLPPFEMALRAGARSVMNSYCDLDGLPVAVDASLLTEWLRERAHFTGTVVSDYFAVAFLETLHGVAASRGDAAGQALAAGIDVELPAVDCYGDPLVEAVNCGTVTEALVDRAVGRVLTQKIELGMLDPGWVPEPTEGVVDLDDAEARTLARRLAQRSIVLLSNDGTLPLRGRPRLAVVGPRAAEATALFGCYSFPVHVGASYPELPLGIEAPTVLDALGDAYEVTYEQACPVLGGTSEGIAAATALARKADVCVAVLGDRSGLFGAGTSGEGCDAADLRLPGRQEELLEALLSTGTPVVLVLLVGRPYELSRQVSRLAAIVCGFFPGEEGAAALADVISGRVNPSGRLPVSFPAAGASQPSTYLAAPLAARSGTSTVDPTPLFPFGHGLSYAPITWLSVSASPGPWPTDGTCTVQAELRNEGDMAASEVVQVYLHDPVAEVARPVRQLIAAPRVDLEPGCAATVSIELSADLASYTGRDGRRIVEPGDVELRVGASSADIRATLACPLVGPRREVGFDRVLTPQVSTR